MFHSVYDSIEIDIITVEPRILDCHLTRFSGYFEHFSVSLDFDLLCI